MTLATLLGSVRFAGDFAPWLVAIVALIAVLGVLYLYGRETRTLGFPYAFLLPALRATAVALVIFILAGPVWHRREVVGTLGRVVFALDKSESMSKSDTDDDDSPSTRLQRATRFLIGDESRVGWLESLRETHDVDVVAFDEADPVLLWSSRDGQPIPNAFDLNADGPATNLQAVLASTTESLNMNSEQDRGPNDQSESAAESYEGDSLQNAAIVLMSDGRVNAGASAVDLARQVGLTGTTVHAIGMGSPDEPPDVSLVDVIRPESVAAEGRLAGELVVRRIGPTDQPVTVRIESGGKTVWQQTMPLGESNRHTIPFDFDVKQIVESLNGETPRGIQRNSVILDLAASVDAPGDDDSTDNNSMPFRVSASTRQRRIMILDSSSRWETRYLRNLFSRDPAWEVDTILFGEGTMLPRLPRGERLGQFPSTDVAMSQYDAVIMGEIDSDQFTASDVNRVAQFVARGGGLILIDGRHGRLRQAAQSDLGELFPVKYLPGEHRSAAGPIQITPLGLEHPIMNLIGDQQRLADFWKKLPAPRSTARVELQPGAEAWAEIPGPGGKASPWLATRMYGSGRVFYFATDQTWRWRYKIADQFHSRFWNQLLIASMPPPYSASDQFASVGTDKVEYEPGQRPTIRVRLRDPRGNPVADSTVDALLIADDKIVGSVPLSVEDPTRGTYLGVAPDLQPGEYTIRVRASGFDESALQATTRVWVRRANKVEMQQVSLDQNALRQIAIAGNGLYVHESQSDRLVDALRPLSSGTVIESDTVLWQSYYWFSAVIALLAIEWWLRKRAGLV
ncbi:VWA domain-containing protein [Stieleria varia]|uniref:Trehalose utilization n=1 Tax=Stieleria varia TaxID=2528005 RepID=A0A5C6B801_9BACT|nr:VWA domain-containing protein [Stieleria varia]TWU07742.1 Trehalose utilization [Stieleria varia]